MKRILNENRYFTILCLVLIAFSFIVGCNGITPSLPIINSFSANPTTITEGESSTLNWSVTGATNVSIDHGIGSVALVGTTTVSPITTTTYTLTAADAIESVTATTTITVDPAETILLINYPMHPTITLGDNIIRGFYIEHFPGTSLTRVDLWIGANTEGDYVFELTAREDIYDGTVIHVSQTAISLTGDAGDKKLLTFNFPSIPILKNSTVTFKVSKLSGPGSCYYAIIGQYGDDTGEDILVTQTQLTSPPLDSFRKHGIAIRVYGHE